MIRPQGTPDDWQSVLDAGCRHPLGVLLRLNNATQFRSRSGGTIGYFEHGRHVISIGGVVGRAKDRPATIREFVAWADAQRLLPSFVHMPPDDTEMLTKLGFRADQLGASYSLRFGEKQLIGSQYRQVRRKIAHGQRYGFTIDRIDNVQDYRAMRPDLIEINQQWLKQKGAKHLRHLVSSFDSIEPGGEHRIYVARLDGRPVSYVVFSRTYGENPGWFHNLSRRRADCPDGSMQMIVSRFMEEIGAGWLHFGFTPLVDMITPEFPHSQVFHRIAAFLSKHGGIVYPARAQRQYKISWAPDRITPEYFAYRGNPLRASLALLRATNSL